MKKLFILLMLSCVFCKAQERQKTDVRLIVNSVLTKQLNKELLGKTPNNHAYLFSITLSFDDAGKIDTVYFSKDISEETSKVFRLNQLLVKRLKMLNLEYKDYSSKLVFIPFFYHRMTDTGIDYENGFLNSIQNLVPQVDGKLGRKDWINLETMMNPFSLNIN